MNKKAIQTIIILMTVALIGIGWLQLAWIKSTVKLNEEKFDKDVFEALNKVADRLDYEERIQAVNYMQSGYSNSYLEKMRQEKSKDSTSYSYPDSPLFNKYDVSSQSDVVNLFAGLNNCNCAACQAEREKLKSGYFSFYQRLDQQPIADRIDLNKLANYMIQELGDQGINIYFKYGVFSKKKNSFVIIDDHFVVEDSQPWTGASSRRSLSNSKYRVSLFTHDGDPAGYLTVYFPLQKSFVWNSVWKMLAATLLFTGIILFSFFYTIQVIFKQKKLSEMKNDFINNMTHEFKTPIATISLASDSIRNKTIANNPEKVIRFANIIKQENKRLNAQVEKVLQMAALEREKFSLNTTDVDVHEIISQAVEYAKLKVEKSDGVVAVDLKAEDFIIQGDQAHIANIINNLLDNAIKYSLGKPEILISTQNRKKGIEITVSDKGMGMNKETRKHIFEKFYRVHTGNVHDIKGFGLGLSYVKSLVDAHHGEITVKSELKKGSSFILYFPFVQK